jgi:hypothetical protein
MNKNINKTNDPQNAMNHKEEVHSNDRKMKQDFPGYPHNPAGEDNLDDRTGLSNESNTTATGSESVREERPTAEENELKSQNDRGLQMHDADNGKE